MAVKHDLEEREQVAGPTIDRVVLHRIPWAPNKELHVVDTRIIEDGEYMVSEFTEILEWVLVNPETSEWKYGKGSSIPYRLLEDLGEGIKNAQAVALNGREGVPDVAS